jgi:glycosyltransferase involved in cell wall biosynthesis
LPVRIGRSETWRGREIGPHSGTRSAVTARGPDVLDTGGGTASAGDDDTPTVSSHPEVTVVIPTRNRLALVREAVSSALGQEDVEIEVLVVDDASADGTAEALRGIGSNRLHVLVCESRGGVSRARNVAVEAARGEWLAFLDDDDLWAPSRLRTGLEAARDAHATLTYSARVILDERRRAVAAVLPERPEDVAALLRWGNVLGGPSAVMVRTEAVRRVGAFDTRLSALADWKLWLQLVRTERLAASPKLLVGYTEHPDNMHRRDPWGVANEFQRLAAEPWGLQQRAFGHWLAAELLAAGDRRSAAVAYLRSARRSGRRIDYALAVAALMLPLGEGFSPPRRPVVAPTWLDAYTRSVA